MMGQDLAQPRITERIMHLAYSLPRETRDLFRRSAAEVMADAESPEEGLSLVETGAKLWIGYANRSDVHPRTDWLDLRNTPVQCSGALSATIDALATLPENRRCVFAQAFMIASPAYEDLDRKKLDLHYYWELSDDYAQYLNGVIDFIGAAAGLLPEDERIDFIMQNMTHSKTAQKSWVNDGRDFSTSQGEHYLQGLFRNLPVTQHSELVTRLSDAREDFAVPGLGILRGIPNVPPGQALELAQKAVSTEWFNRAFAKARASWVFESSYLQDSGTLQRVTSLAARLAPEDRLKFLTGFINQHPLPDGAVTDSYDLQGLNRFRSRVIQSLSARLKNDDLASFGTALVSSEFLRNFVRSSPVEAAYALGKYVLAEIDGQKFVEAHDLVGALVRGDNALLAGEVAVFLGKGSPAAAEAFRAQANQRVSGEILLNSEYGLAIVFSRHAECLSVRVITPGGLTRELKDALETWVPGKSRVYLIAEFRDVAVNSKDPDFRRHAEYALTHAGLHVDKNYEPPQPWSERFLQMRHHWR